MKAIQNRLSPSETVIEYFIVQNDLYIFVVSRASMQCIRRPASISNLEREWIHLERHLASCSVKWERLGVFGNQLERTALSHLQALYAELVGPVESLVNETVVFVPHGFLHGIPFHALHDGRRFVSDKCRVAYSPSATLYCMPGLDEKHEPPLFVGFRRNGRLSVAEEIEEAASHFSDATVLVNPTIVQLRHHLNRPRKLIHLAGHAGIDPVRGTLSWIETADGFLTSRDFLDLQIRAETLVVTGCHTAQRKICAGDEWLGLMRAFYLSGATTIVSAFWAIRDEAARYFARHFYRHYDGGNALSAVQSTAAAMREWRPHPYFWAGFGTFIRKSGDGPRTGENLL